MVLFTRHSDFLSSPFLKEKCKCVGKKKDSLMIATVSLTFLNGARILKTISEYHILLERLKLLIVFFISF